MPTLFVHENIIFRGEKFIIHHNTISRGEKFIVHYNANTRSIKFIALLKSVLYCKIICVDNFAAVIAYASRQLKGFVYDYRKYNSIQY